jgi:hypothetical protein
VVKVTTIDVPAEAGKARKLRQRLSLDQLDYRRELARLAELGAPQVELSRVLGISQPSLSSALKKARDTQPPREGFSGSDPFEICQRYAVGELTREQVIDELTRWEYVPLEPRQHDYFDDLRFDTPGSIEEIGRAFDAGLIDGEIHDTVLDRVTGNAA